MRNLNNYSNHIYSLKVGDSFKLCYILINLYLSGVKLHGKTSRVPQGFRATTLMNDSWETNNYRRLNSRGSKEICTCQVRNVMGDLKETLCTSAPGMDNTFWDTFPIKICKLLHKMIILQQNWTCQKASSNINILIK